MHTGDSRLRGRFGVDAHQGRHSVPLLPVLPLGVMLACVLLLAGCDSAPPSPEVKPPSVTMSFIQQRIDENTPRAQLRVVNGENRDLVVTGVGLDWDGFGERWMEPYDTTVRQHQTLDLRVTLPAPDCSAGKGPAFGLVEVDGAPVRARLDESGRGFLTRIWTRVCMEEFVSQRVDIAYGPTWRRLGDGTKAVLRGSIDLTRRDSDEEIGLAGVEGSVLFALRLGGRAVMSPDESTATFPLVVLPGRCDDHALGESSQTFLFKIDVQVGAADPVRLTVVPDGRAQAKALHVLAEACR